MYPEACIALTLLRTTSRYFNDILNINNVYFDNMVCQIYSAEFQRNKTKTSDTDALFLYIFHLYFIVSMSYKIISTMTSKLWPLTHSMHVPLQSRLKAFCGSIHHQFTIYTFVTEQQNSLYALSTHLSICIM